MDLNYKQSDIKYLFNPGLLIKNEMNEFTIKFLEDSNNFQLRPLCSTDYDCGKVNCIY